MSKCRHAREHVRASVHVAACEQGHANAHEQHEQIYWNSYMHMNKCLPMHVTMYEHIYLNSCTHVIKGVPSQVASWYWSTIRWLFNPKFTGYSIQHCQNILFYKITPIFIFWYCDNIWNCISAVYVRCLCCGIIQNPILPQHRPNTALKLKLILKQHRESTNIAYVL